MIWKLVRSLGFHLEDECLAFFANREGSPMSYLTSQVKDWERYSRFDYRSLIHEYLEPKSLYAKKDTLTLTPLNKVGKPSSPRRELAGQLWAGFAWRVESDGTPSRRSRGPACRCPGSISGRTKKDP